MAEYIERPEVEGRPVHQNDVLLDGGKSVTVGLCCEDGYLWCTDGRMHHADGLRWPSESTSEDIIAEVMGGTKSLADAVAALSTLIVREWQEGVAYRVDDKVTYDDVVYRCVQAHTSQADWTPNATPALWARGYKPDEVPEWVQPTGAHDAYMLGAKVTHIGKTWESDVDNNVWEPGVYGWSEV